jgi:chromosome segregation ATPase
MNSYGQTIVENKRWKLAELSTDQGVYCVASTKDDAVFRAETFHLELIKLKNQANKPVEVLFKIEKNKKGSKGAVAELPGGKMVFSALSTDNRENFWGLPRGISALIEKLKSSEDTVEMKAIGGSKEIEFNFDGRGFSAILSEMEKRCNAGQVLVSKEFESRFSNSISSQVDPLRIGKNLTAQLRGIYYSAYNDFMAMKETQQGLARVLAKYQGHITELNSVKATLENLNSIEIPTAQRTLDSAFQQQRVAEAEIVRLDQLIPQLQQKVNASQAAYDQARSVLAPLEPENSRLLSILRDAQNLLSSSEERLSEIESRLSQITRELSSLRQELESLERQQPFRRSELNQARSELRDAERRRSAYNINFERESRLRNNGEYQNLRSERVQIEAVASQMAQELRQVRGERERIARMLEQCRANNESIVLPGESLNPEPVPGEDSNGGASGTIGEVPKPKPDIAKPATDCTALEQSLAEADRQIQEKENGLREVERRSQQVNGRLDEIERIVDNNVRREYEILSRREDEARDRLERIEDIVRREETRISDLRISLIPRIEREEFQLSNERPRVINSINQARASKARAETELATFRSRNDWDRKAAAVDSAVRQLRDDQSRLSGASGERRNNVARLEEGKRTEAIMRGRLQDLNGRVAGLRLREAELNQLLAGLPAERAPFDLKIAELSAKIDQQRDQFLNLTRQ